MTWVSFVCLLALSSSALGHYGNAYRARLVNDRVPMMNNYGSTQQLQGGSGIVLDQTVATQPQQQQQRPFLASLSLNTQGQSQPNYGQQQQQLPQTVDLPSVSSLGVQQDTQILPTQSSNYGSSYGSQQIPQQPIIQQQQIPKRLPVIPTQIDQTSFGGSPYGSVLPQQPARIQPQQDVSRSFGRQQFLDQPQQTQQQVITPTPADIMCQGQRPETVIPLETGRKFVVCLDDSKGVEQHCPKGLHYHVESRRCERKLGALEHPCASQPCLNGGQCGSTDNIQYQCQCPAGFEGKTCELDARVCQSQQPCGQSPDSRCQSFRLGAALQYVCICHQETAYGLNCQQAQPNPCQGVDGPQSLSFTDKGFIMCDGERMFAESCPGGTVWDDQNKACVWPDMVGVTASVQREQSSLQGYGQQTSRVSMINQPISKTFIQRPQQLDQPMIVRRPQPQLDQSVSQSSMSSYGQSQIQRPQFDQTITQPQLPQQQWQKPEQQLPTWQKPEQQLPTWQKPEQQLPTWQKPEQQLPSWQKPEQQLPSWQKPQQLQGGFQQIDSDQTSSYGGQQSQIQSRLPQQHIPKQQQDLIQSQQSSAY